MKYLSEVSRLLCFCMVMKGSWSPQTLAPVTTTITKKNEDSKNKKLKEAFPKPEWLKEWTISKGWVHNKSHLMSLGRENSDEDSSSISTEDIEELISIETPPAQQDLSLVFHQISENYRQNFPENPHKYTGDFQLPEIYKERLLIKENGAENIFASFWNNIKPKKKVVRDAKNFKFTVNELYDTGCPDDRQLPSTSDELIVRTKSTLGKNIAMYNTLNSRTNLHEEPIYECSEENLSIYNNPIYSPDVRYFDFRSNNNNKQSFRYGEMVYNRRGSNGKNALKTRLRTEKYIIRHIKVRIMLSLRIGHWKKKRYRRVVREEMRDRSVGDMYETISRTHDEQRRIGNGKTSIKIQNMRHGRLNVLRWLLWEAEFRDKNNMPALERATNNTTLALHYAAARGCLDCVRLLVDSTPDLRSEWSFAFNHHVKKHHSNLQTVQAGPIPKVKPHNYQCGTVCNFSARSSLLFTKHLEMCQKRSHNILAIPKNVQAEEAPQPNPRNELRSETFKFTCEFCPYKTDGRGKFKAHSLKHVPEDKIVWFYCSECAYRTYRRGSLREHVKVKHRTGPEIGTWFACSKCSYKSRKKGGLKKHMLTHAASHEIDWFKCEQCSYRSKVKSSMVNHMLRHVDADKAHWLYCNNCSYRSKFKHGLVKHMIVHLNPQKIDWLHCQHCSYRGKTKEHLRLHLRMHLSPDDINWYDCAKCAFRTKYKNKLNNHSLIHAAKIVWHSCPDCPNKYLDERQLLKHKRIHRPPQDWLQCPKCPYRSKWHLKQHEKAVHSDPAKVDWFHCAKCPYKTMFKHKLKCHMLVHARPEEIDWFVCEHCGYRTKRRSELKAHSVRHMESKDGQWFGCAHCSYRSRRKGVLKNHLRTHALPEEIEWFPCSECSYKGKDKNKLKQHMLKHAEPKDIDWFYCQHCKYKAKQKSWLMTHVKLMHARPEDIRWFSCDQCLYKSKQKVHLKEHISRMHSDSVR